jgi:hypothetical protein
MLLPLGSICRIPAGMDLKMDKKSYDILKAISAGQSCEQILASDGTLTYHDIFHALTEAPTNHWKKTSAKGTGGGLFGDATSGPAPSRRRRD